MRTNLSGRACRNRERPETRSLIYNIHRARLWLTGEPFYFWVFACAALLARAHSRMGDAAKIAGYCGRSEVLDEALAEFAESLW